MCPEGDEMKKVRLLLSGNKNLQYYVDAVEAAGGEATAKYLPEVDTGYDGLILCGGNDINPQYYQEALCGAVDLDNTRDEAEFALLKAYLDAGKPVLGICRGHQLINVFFGGSLHQDLPNAAMHTNREDHYLVHQIETEEGSVLGTLYGPCMMVNSCHHQAVKKLGDGLRATAWWNGQCVEAFEHNCLPVLGVQWHPERMCAGQKRQDAADGLPVFQYFIGLCEGK
jgi:putative glutamine amidotransferase